MKNKNLNNNKVLNKDFCTQTDKEELNDIILMFYNFFQWDIKYEEMNEESFKNSTNILYKTNAEKKQSIIEHRNKRRNDIKNMVLEAYTNGESRKFTFAKSRKADYILELNLIRSTTKKAEDYYTTKKKNE